MPRAAVARALAAGRDIVVFDLEFTAWEGSQAHRWSRPGEHREVVQIGAVRLDPAAGLREVAACEIVVRPRINPVLSDYFVSLTGLTQRRVERDGVPFPVAIAGFLDFCEGAVALLSNGPDHAVLAENVALNGPAPTLPDRLPDSLFVNAGPLLAAAAGGGGHISSARLPDHFPGVPALPGHDAVADARMVAAALRAVLSASV